MLEWLLPKGKKPGRPPAWSRRQLINGIRFQVRTGTPWGHARRVRSLGPGVGPISSLAAGRHLVSDLHCPAGTGRHGGPDHLGSQHRLHRLPGPPARRRCAGRGTCRRSRLVGSPRSRTTTGLDVHAAA
ncbi:hypothetical protein [Streptomyces sp. NPDC101237]|uniref:hypothetical protein n=1 Tax=Streptomyces sp. NPDC101237 TaxID=3366139 RepID=UPI00380B352E